MKKELTIMIIDDCYEDRKAYCRYLSREANYHYKIFEAECGEDALAKYASIQPELILLDYLLPDFDGLEFIEHLQAQTDNLPPIVMLSGQGNEAVAVKAIQSGAYDYCVKDYITVETLNKTLDNVLEKHRLNTSLAKNKRQQKLIKDVALRILQSPNLQDLFTTIVTEVHKLLECDRILLCRFDADLSGHVVAESVKDDWRELLEKTIANTYFPNCDRDKYRQDKILTFDDIDTIHFGEYQHNFLVQFQVKAEAVVPILLRSSQSEGDLWGLLIAHYCHNTHQWQKDEIDILEELSLHLSIAIQQAELLKNLTDELARRKQAEAKIRLTQKQIVRANSLLEERVKERTKELDRAKQAAETANRSKDSFLAHISHELRTPLNSILGFTQILKKDSNLCKIQYRHLDSIYQSGKYLLVLIDDILDLSKITARKLDLEPYNFNFQAFIDSLTELIRLQAQKKELNFDCQLLSPLPKIVYGDETRLRQVLLNLLNNAVKFTEVGSVTFIVESVPNSQQLRFQIRDTGMGISTEQLNNIFLPFEQLSNRQGNKKGTGLGLAISTQLVRLMDSQIEVQSTLGKGSTFSFEVDLPAVDSGNAKFASEHQARPINFEGQRRKILVVDDDSNNRRVLIHWLKPLGFELLEAENGLEGLALASSFRPDLILLDLVMPVMDGIEMATRIRQDAQFQKVIIFAISANAKFNSNINAQQNIFEAFLSKPIDLNQLLDLLEANLELKRITTESEANNSDIFSQPELIPSSESLEKLLRLVNLGDVSQTVAEAESLEQLNKQYAPFSQQVKQLAFEFQLQKLVVLLKSKIES